MKSIKLKNKKTGKVLTVRKKDYPAPMKRRRVA